jgi:hypothetical protein
MMGSFKFQALAKGDEPGHGQGGAQYCGQLPKAIPSCTSGSNIRAPMRGGPAFLVHALELRGTKPYGPETSLIPTCTKR